MKLDYDAQLASTKNYEISGEDTFCKKPITDPRKAGEVWVDDEGILPFASAACTLGAYADFKSQGQEDQRRLRLRYRARHQAVRRSGLLRGRRQRGSRHSFLKKDAEAYAAKTDGKVLGFDEAREGGRRRRQDVSSPAVPAAAGAGRLAAIVARPIAAGGARSAAGRPAARPSPRSPHAGSVLNKERLRAVAIGAISLSSFCSSGTCSRNTASCSSCASPTCPRRSRSMHSFAQGDPRSQIPVAHRVELPPHPHRLHRSRPSSACRLAW